MSKTGRPTRNRRSLFVASVVLAAAAIGFGGCCCTPKLCTQGTDYIVTISKEDGECVICPDSSSDWDLEPGMKIQFVNMSQDVVDVEAGMSAYVEGHIFTIDKCSSTVRTVAELPAGVESREILHTIKCWDGSHGGPKMVVTEPETPGGGS